MKKSILLLILMASLYMPSLAANKINSLNLQEREINGSLVNYEANKVIIPFAKKIGLNRNIKIQEVNKKNAEKIPVTGEFNLDGDLVIDLNTIGVSELLESKVYRIAATASADRKKYVSKFTYHAPRIVRGTIEVPVSKENIKNFSNNAVITVVNPLTKKKVNEIKTIVATGKTESFSIDKKEYTKLIYPLFTEIPSNTKSRNHIYEINSTLAINVDGKLKNISLSSLIDIRDLNNKDKMLLKGINATPASTVAVKIVDSAIEKIKGHSGINSNIPETYETYLKLSRVFNEANNSSSIEESISNIKKEINANSSALFKELFEYISRSKSITNLKDASKLTLSISFKPTLITDESLNKFDDVVDLDEIVKSIEQNSSEKDTYIIKSLI